MIRRYSELICLPTFSERLKYLMLEGRVGDETFGIERYLNQRFYMSQEWKSIRSNVIVRDLGCDLADPNCPIPNGASIIIHHMNPITIDDIYIGSDYLTNPEYLICVSNDTHRQIHYGYANAVQDYVERAPFDTSPWRKT